jgi:5-formyltetrahydrofolate cyclo-ligase
MELRRRMKAAREAIPPAERDLRAAAIEELLFALAPMERARTVMAFSSFGSEVPTRAVVRRLQREGRRVLLPFLEGPRMRAAEVRAGRPTVPSGYGPEEPEPGGRTPADPSSIEVVIVPGLAFDRRGFRLGYGGGHYDHFLSDLPPEAVRVGIAFHEQVVDEVPHEPDDLPVDLVVTDRETIETNAR